MPEPLLYKVVDNAYHNAIKDAPKILQDNPRLAAAVFGFNGAYDSIQLTQQIIRIIAPEFSRNTLPKFEKACIIGLGLGLTYYLLTTSDKGESQYPSKDKFLEETLNETNTNETSADPDLNSRDDAQIYDATKSKERKTHVYHTNKVYTTGMIFAGLGAILAATVHVMYAQKTENARLARKKRLDAEFDAMLIKDMQFT